jgi:triacylglycerol lipase
MATLDFKADATTFKAENALYLATASDIAYLRTQEEIKAHAASDLGLDEAFGFFNIKHPVLDEDTQAFAACNATHAVISFRGTQEWNDWMTNLSATPAKFRWFFTHADDIGNVHAGFSHGLCDCWKEIDAWLEQNVKGTTRTLWFTGHSLGAALAALAAAVCSFDVHLPVSGLYTFGQPRIGQQDFCMSLDYKIRSRYFRFVNRHDLVPRVPFRGWDYSDCGQMIHFDLDPTVPPSVQSVTWRNFLSRSIESFKDVFEMVADARADIADHSLRKKDDTAPPGYIDSLTTHLAYLGSNSFLKTLS